MSVFAKAIEVTERNRRMEAAVRLANPAFHPFEGSEIEKLWRKPSRVYQWALPLNGGIAAVSIETDRLLGTISAPCASRCAYCRTPHHESRCPSCGAPR